MQCSVKTTVYLIPGTLPLKRWVRVRVGGWLCHGTPYGDMTGWLGVAVDEGWGWIGG